MIEYPIGIQASDAALQSVEMDVAKRWEILIETIERAELEVATRLSVVKVDAELGAVNIERHLFLLGLVLVPAEEVLYIEGITQKYPSPSEVDTEFGTQRRREVEAL